MNRLQQCFTQLKNDKRKALVTYIISGDPGREATLAAMHALTESGADIIELGVPFSDPMADGPTIQLGHERALANKMTLQGTLDIVKAFRESNTRTPVVLMGYDNPVERMGYGKFGKAAAEAGVDGLIAVDLPPEEARELNHELKNVGLENIFLLAPTTSLTRAKQIIELAGGFLYYVSLKGVTGAGHLDVKVVNDKLAEFRSLTELPICVGFGIKDGTTAKAVTEKAEGAVIGSLLVNTMGDMAGQSSEAIAQALANVVKPIREAMDS